MRYHKKTAPPIGIKARAQRGPFGTERWAERWVVAIEALADRSRLQRGRTYARKGNVLSIELRPGMVHAQVQGSRGKPYSVRLYFQPIPSLSQLPFLERVSGTPALLAPLLNGILPQTLEDLFEAADVPLFLNAQDFRRFFCTCQDTKECCKHMIAVLYLLAEAFDQDPLLLLKLRGLSREQLLETAFKEQEAPQIGEEGEWDAITGGSEVFLGVLEPDAMDAGFYGEAAAVEKLASMLLPTTETALCALPEFPFWRGSRSFQESMATFYAAAEEYAKKLDGGG